MVSVRARNRRRRVLRYAFGGALCLVTVVAARAGLQWYWSVATLCGALLIIVPQRRIFRAGVTRSGDEIVCRYIPWYEGNAYSALVLIPLMGVAAIGAGHAPGNPAWLLPVGVMLLGVLPLVVFSAVLVWRRSLLRITSSMVTVRLVERGSELIDIPREQVESIEPRIVSVPVNVESLQVAITYRPVEESGDTTRTVIIGLRLTVKPVNLLHALVAWKDGADEHPSELLDRVEQILRGCSSAGG